MVLNEYTTFADIRAVLGVSVAELKDSVIGLDVYSFNLTAELKDVHATVPSKYTAIRQKAEADRTEEEQQFFETVRNFSTYAVARQLCTSLPMFGPKEISDSKTLVARFSDSPYKETIKAIKDMYDLNRMRLSNAYAALTSSAAASLKPTLMAVSSPSTDRVTG